MRRSNGSSRCIPASWSGNRSGFSLVAGGLLFQGLADQEVAVQSARVDLAVLHGGLEGAAGFFQMAAVPELTIAKMRPELDKTLRQLVDLNIPMSEFTYAGGVVHIPCGGHVEQPSSGGGMGSLAGVLCQLLNADLLVGQQHIRQ